MLFFLFFRGKILETAMHTFFAADIAATYIEDVVMQNRIETTTYPDEDLTIHRLAGALTSGDIIAKLADYFDGKQTSLVIWDFRNCEVSPVGFNGLREVAATGGRFSSGRVPGKTALVFVSKSAYGFGRTFETYAELKDLPIELRSFLSMDEAKAWLGE